MFFQVPEACTNIHFSPIGDYLVTSHICNLGLYLWSNKTLFSYVSLEAIDANKPILVILKKLSFLLLFFSKLFHFLFSHKLELQEEFCANVIDVYIRTFVNKLIQTTTLFKHFFIFNQLRHVNVKK